MIQRPTQASIFSLVRSGLLLNQGKLARAQEQVATGKRILRPSDDAVGTSMSMAVRRHQGSVEAFRSAIATARPVLATASSELQQGSSMLTEGRALMLQGMNGTLGPDGREAVADQLELVAESLLNIANSRSGERFLFSGTNTSSPPFEMLSNGRVEYRGNQSQQSVLIGRGVELDINVPGDEIFGKFEFSGLAFDGVTGIQPGTSASSGAGYQNVNIRHTGTTGAPGAGITLANGGADDTIIGDHTVDITGGIATLGTGYGVVIPTPPPASLELTDADGSTVFLDMTAWTGGDTNFTLTGSGSISLNGSPYQPLDLTETNLELIDEATGVVLHLDTTNVTRAAPELVTLEGTTNIFDTINGVIEDLRNEEGFTPAEIVNRINDRLGEFDRHHENLLVGLGKLGARTGRVDKTEERLGDLSVHLDSLISSVEDADITDVVLEMTRAEQTLQIAQGTGARLINQSLLDFLR